MDNEIVIDLGQVEPIKGTDYYTLEDINEFNSLIINEIKSNLRQIYQTTINKVNELNEKSSNNEYPNAQLVYEKLHRLSDLSERLSDNLENFNSNLNTFELQLQHLEEINI